MVHDDNVGAIIVFKFGLLHKKLSETIVDNICSEVFYSSPKRLNGWGRPQNKRMPHSSFSPLYIVIMTGILTPKLHLTLSLVDNIMTLFAIVSYCSYWIDLQVTNQWFWNSTSLMSGCNL